MHDVRHRAHARRRGYGGRVLLYEVVQRPVRVGECNSHGRGALLPRALVYPTLLLYSRV